MMRFKKTTPEEKLLHIIENPEEASKPSFGKGIKLSQGIGILSPFKRIDFKKISLQGINKGLIALSVIATMAAIFTFYKGEETMRARFENLKADIEKEIFQLSKNGGSIPALAKYLSSTESNNPFHVLPVSMKSKVEKEEKKINLKLVGIIWSDLPQAIVEDETSKKTYVVYKGDTVDKYQVKAITKNEVRLTSEDGDEVLR